ncbi:hypothetical protein [Bradyrhizobium diversitatis]|uniref:hypothetical protein n=1 Tax=Bradyrhizobium diversitatis TaxID=2755406 RepID=UPI001FE986F5|nr:hypothetical protein [Bradyrhizobium diversitatis]
MFCLRHERHLVDQGTEQLCRLGFLPFALQAFIKGRDVLPIDLRHVRVQERREFFGIREQIGQLRLASFERIHLSLHRRLVHAVLDRGDDASNLLFDSSQFALPSILIGSTFDPQPVHFTGEFLAELLEQFGLHQVRPEAAQYGCLQRIAPDV